MSDLRALVRIKEKELRCLEWTLVAHKAQEATGTLVPESLREELQDCRSEQQVRWTPGVFKVKATTGSKTLVYCGRAGSSLAAPHGKSCFYQSRIPPG